MKLLLIEICNYVNYPTGGHLSFARNLISVYKDDIAIVRISTDMNERNKVGTWSDFEIDGHIYKSFLVGVVKPESSKPLIPSRLRSYILMLRWRKKMLRLAPNYDYIFVQTPEVLFSLPRKYLSRTCVRLPGLENPLQYSRYFFAPVLAKLFSKILYRRVSQAYRILATANQESISTFIKKSQGSIDPNKLIQFPTRYNEKLYRLQSQKELRNSLSLPETSVIYITVGRLAKYKGLEFLLESFNMISDHECLFLIIGDGEYDTKIRKYINENHISNVIFFGRLEPHNICKYLAASDVFLMGSYVEGWPTSLVEAVATGLPCVVTEFSGAEEMVKDAYNGYVIKNRDVKEFSQRMIDARHIPQYNLSEAADKIRYLSIGKLRDAIENILK